MTERPIVVHYLTRQIVLRLLAVFLEIVFLLGTAVPQFSGIPVLPAWQAAALVCFFASFI